jgi:hypothetical protein
MDEPEHGVQHVDEFAREAAVVLPGLCLVLQYAGQMHDSHLSLTIEWDARTVAEFLSRRVQR